jgi:hypothetical protein
MAATQVKSENEKIRVQFDLIPSQVEALENLMTVCALDTRKDLVNNAITLLEWAVGQVKLGKEIVSLDREERSYEVLRTPALMAAARSLQPKSAISARELADEQRKAVVAAQREEEAHRRSSHEREHAGGPSLRGLFRGPATA